MSGADWTPVHHVEADDPPVEPGGKPEGAHTDSKSKGGTGKVATAVTLTLSLPDDFTKAVVTAIQENTKVLQAILKAMTNDGNRPDGDEGNPPRT